MEICLMDVATGQSECTPVPEDMTVGKLHARTNELFHYTPGDTVLLLDGTDLSENGGAASRLQDCEGIQALCTVEVHTTTARYISGVKSTATPWDQIPDWAKEDPEVVIAAISSGVHRVFRNASQALRATREVVLAAVSHSGHNLQFADPSLQDDPEVVGAAVRSWKGAVQYTGPIHRSDAELVLEMIKADPLLARHAHPSLLENIGFASEALLLTQGRGLEHFSENVRGDRDIVMQCVLRCARQFEYASEALRGDRAFVMSLLSDLSYTARRGCLPKKTLFGWWAGGEAVATSHIAAAPLLQHMSEELRCDKAVVSAALALNPDSLEFASEELRADRALVLRTVRASGRAMRHVASADLFAGAEVVLAALPEYPDVLSRASESLLSDKTFILKALKEGTHIARVFGAASQALRLDEAVALAAVEAMPLLYTELPDEARLSLRVTTAAVSGAPHLLQGSCVPEELWASRPFLLIAMNRRPESLEQAPPNLKDDEEVVTVAVQSKPACLRHASPRLRDTFAVVREAVRRLPTTLEFAGPEMQCNRELVSMALAENPFVLTWASTSLSEDREFILAAVRRRGHALCAASPTLRDDRGIVLAAVRAKGTALRFASERLRADREVVTLAVRDASAALLFASDDLRNDVDLLRMADESRQQKGGVFRDLMSSLRM